MSGTLCEGCGQHSFLLPLRNGKGGPLRCPLCVGEWNAEHGRKRRTGRILVRAMMAFFDAGGTNSDFDKLKNSAAVAGIGMFCEHSEFADPLGYMDGIARLDGADVDLTSELLAEVLQLTHPDHHPPERRELASRDARIAGAKAVRVPEAEAEAGTRPRAEAIAPIAPGTRVRVEAITAALSVRRLCRHHALFLL
jgi:hypothetical protein